MQERVWSGREMKSKKGTLDEIHEGVPTFKKIPFAHDGSESKNLDAIIKNETDDTACMPIATVSKGYKLIQHHEVFNTVKTAVGVLDFPVDETECMLEITEHGERMWFRMQFPEEFRFDPGDGNDLTLEFHAFNSVDRSMPLKFEFGYYRFICANGLISAGQRLGESKRRHTGSLNIEMFLQMFLANVDAKEQEQEVYTLLHDKKVAVGEGFLESWIDKTVSPRWGKRLAARGYHIISTGHDGKIDLAETLKDERHLAHKINVVSETRVPGQPEESENLLDVTNALSWISSHHPTMQTRQWLMKDVNALVTDLERTLGKDTGLNFNQ